MEVEGIIRRNMIMFYIIFKTRNNQNAQQGLS